ncbi:MAG TPA: P-type conjugative transfer protein TrbJ, partial [Devosia sp.]|nr:P-type conjugative transfer protein TrbJ [Devosia sp.]
QINNQIQSLRNEAQMLTNMGKELQALGLNELGPILHDLDQVRTLIDQPMGISFDLGETQAMFTQLWPQSYAAATPNETLQSDGLARWQHTMQAFLQTLSVGSQIMRSVQGDSASLSALVGASQSAAGNLEATQATNQLLALTAKQQIQTQSLMAAQYRADTLSRASDAEAEVQGRAAFANFAGTGTAYTPQ